MKHAGLTIVLAAFAAAGLSVESHAGQCRTVCDADGCHADCPSEAPQVSRPANPRTAQSRYPGYQPPYYRPYYQSQYRPVRCGWVPNYYTRRYVWICQ